METNDVELVVYIATREFVQLDSIAKKLNKNISFVKNNISKINEKFKGLIYIDENNDVSIVKNSIENILKYKYLDLSVVRDNLTIETRRELLLIYILTNSKYISLLDLSEFVSVSKNTVLNDINYLRKELKEKSLNLDYSRKTGYVLLGDEYKLRQIINKIIRRILILPIGKYILTELEIIDVDETVFLKRRLENVENRLSITFTDEVLDLLPYISYAVVKRIRNFNIKCEFPAQIKELENTNEYITVATVFWNYAFLKENDLLYLVLLVLSSNVIENDFSTDKLGVNDISIEQSIEDFITSVENRLAITFSERKKLEISLKQHILPAIYRNILGIQVKNPLLEQFATDYQNVFNIVTHEMSHFEKYTVRGFTEDEIAYISMIVSSSLVSQNDTPFLKYLNAVVVCKSGTSISNLLLVELKELFPMINIEKVMSLRQYEEENISNDFVFSTVPIEQEKNVYYISTLMTDSEKLKLKNDIENSITADSRKEAKFIISNLKEFLEPDTEQKAVDKLHKLFSAKKDRISSKEKKTILNDISQISIHNGDIEWNTALRLSFTPLLKRETITDDYVNAAEKNFERYYEYQTIGPGVLLPHSKPEDGVNEVDVQINIFNDPVIDPNGYEHYFIIALAPDKSRSHLNWLMNINDKLKEQGFRKTLLKEKDLNRILKLLE